MISYKIAYDGSNNILSISVIKILHVKVLPLIKSYLQINRYTNTIRVYNTDLDSSLPYNKNSRSKNTTRHKYDIS